MCDPMAYDPKQRRVMDLHINIVKDTSQLICFLIG